MQTFYKKGWLSLSALLALVTLGRQSPETDCPHGVQLALARLSSKANSACRSRCTRWRRFCSSLEAEVDAASIARC